MQTVRFLRRQTQGVTSFLAALPLALIAILAAVIAAVSLGQAALMLAATSVVLFSAWQIARRIQEQRLATVRVRSRYRAPRHR